ncbi:MAG: hypothetical protein HDR18_11670 [Lachnospiraceae bacterium]|nr:hypothetical protein [Lachnospiraceae bacterium]
MKELIGEFIVKIHQLNIFLQNDTINVIFNIILIAILGLNMILCLWNYRLCSKYDFSLARFEMRKNTDEKNFLKNTKEENIKSLYTDLTPIDNLDGEQESIKALHWALNNKQIKNIALTGPYGSGKSSVINSYLKLHKECKAIKISLATFDGYTWDKISELQRQEKYDEAKSLLKESEDELEKGVLKQLFYGVNADKIPLSRYRKLHHVKLWKYIVCVLFMCVVILSTLYLAMPNKVLDFYNQNYSSKIGSLSDMSVILVAFLVFVLGAGCLLKVITSKFRIKEISVGEASVQGEELSTDSVLNKNIDEMLYFFERTKYDVVFVEDLDRFNTTSIFIKLRELNAILNNYEILKRKIVFVYAVKDDLFGKETERTKFFDFLIPVIPVINSTNSGEIMRNLLGMGDKKIDNKEYPAHKISEEFITIVSPFINDMRILISTINEFWIYKKTLLNEHEDYMDDECMLALMIYKNTYPSDFALLECEAGDIKAAFEYKENAMKNAKENLEFQRKQLECKQKDTLKSLKELKIVILSEIVDNEGIVLYITVNGKRYDYIKLLSDEFDFALLNNNSINITYKGNNSVYNSSKQIGVLSEYNKTVDELCVRYDAQRAFIDKQDEEILLEFEKIDRSIIRLRANSVQQLLADYPKEDVLPGVVCKNELLVLLLRHGYINENYADYINHFYPGSISKEELNFILSVRNFKSLNDFAFPIKHCKNVANKLLDYEFEQKEILNFDMMDYLLNSISNEVKLAKLIKHLTDRSDLSLKFIKEYIERNKNVTNFLQALCHASGYIWKDIENDETLSKDAKDKYLKLIIDACDIDDIKKNDYEIEDMYAGGIRNYIEEDNHILVKLSGIEISKIKDVIVELGICFHSLDFGGVDRELFDFIIEQRCYKLNYLMIYAIFRIIKPECLPVLFMKNFHCIEESGCDSLINYVYDNMLSYVTDIILLGDKNTEENTEDVEKIVERLVALSREGKCKKDLCIKVIQKEHLAYWKQLSSCLSNCIDEEKKDIWDYLLANQRAEASWDNYMEYRMHYGVTDTLVQYADKNMDVLANSHSEDGPTDSVIKELLIADISIESFEVLIKAHRVKEFTNSFIEFGEREIEIMIEEHYFDFTPKSYNELKERADGLHTKFAIENYKEFFEQINECDIDIDDVKKLLNEDALDKQEVELLLNSISLDDIDEELALQMRKLGVVISQVYVCAAWDVLKHADRYQLFLNQLDAFTLDEVAHRLDLLGNPYDQFAERKRHKYKLFASEYNQKLCQRLYDRGFLSSCDVVDEKVGFDSEANKDKTKKYIVGYVKKKV